MKSKILININNLTEIEDYKKVGVTTFLFALKNYCVGYQNEFTIDEINSIKEDNKYVLINRVLDCKDVDELKELLNKDLNIKGIIYEDIAVCQIVKMLNKDIELICFQNHFNSNTRTVNFWLDRVDSVVVCNELTKNELENIVNNASKPIVLQVYGHNQAMYSRRKLLSNYSDEFHLETKNPNTLVEKVTGIKFIAIENNYGTILYSGNIFNGLDLLNLELVMYYYVNTTFISHEDIMSMLNTLESLDGDSGFLNKETIYKLKEAK